MKRNEFNKFIQGLMSEYNIKKELMKIEPNGVIKLGFNYEFDDFANYHIFYKSYGEETTIYNFSGPRGFTVIIFCEH